jgi:hypothetical protein
VTATLLRFAPGQRHVDVSGTRGGHDLVDREALPHGFHTSKRLEEHRQMLLCDAEDLEVDVFGRMAAETIADPSSDDEGASSRIVHG